MKILDRYISASIAAAFLSGVTMFMVLICAMDLLKDMIELIAQQGVPARIAVTIFAYRVPGMLVYAFPMALLLGILLVFGRMSSESEMVAIRASGVSFVRVIMPTLLIALLVSGMTFYISNIFAPYASKRSQAISNQVLNKLDYNKPVNYTHTDDNGKVIYSIQASGLNIKDEVTATLIDVTVLNYRNGVPSRIFYAGSATWNSKKGCWESHGKGFIVPVSQSPQEISLFSNSDGAVLNLASSLLQVKESPFELKSGKKDPNELTSDEIREFIAELRRSGDSKGELGKWRTRLAQRYSTPFTCLVFALIGAPLGLRHHRTSSAVGFGVSLLVIFIYYFTSVYLSSFGDSGRLPPLVVAWLPNIIGTALGVYLVARANK
ncbi:MAG TPA: LptF/LptG family permease [Armatimonadota bacterium]|nr:LptF/LptG family permease [Armatimonadota bacterium]